MGIKRDLVTFYSQLGSGSPKDAKDLGELWGIRLWNTGFGLAESALTARIFSKK